jgi:putative oxygen-independent coproporphyrinogen III oxidase
MALTGNIGNMQPAGIYIHWPFCAAKCPYCDFNSHVSNVVDYDAWQRAYLADLRRYHGERPDIEVQSVFFGGGTPSLMPPSVTGAILDEIAKLWSVSDDMEVTLEANPTSSDAARFAGFRAAGVGRMSVGVQSLNDQDLRLLGRMHSAKEARATVARALTLFPRVSADLIYARQGQTVAAWRAELAQAIDLGTSHLSLYQLTIEDGTVFAARHARGLLRGLPDEDVAAELYEITQDLTKAQGLHAYEVSNHAHTSHECRHNLIYWRSKMFLGVGPGAHGRIDIDDERFATVAHRMPTAWLEALQHRGNGEISRDRLGGIERAEEYVLMGLRLSEGISVSHFQRLANQQICTDAISRLRHDDLVEHKGDRLIATQKGRMLLNHVTAEVLSNF